MLKHTTTFILGAGAHCPYGMPDGGRLTLDILEMLPIQSNANKTFTDLFKEVYINQIGQINQVLSKFREKLANSGHPTIDSFLYGHRNETGFPEVGKFAVATALRPKEFKYSFARRAPPENEQDWLSYLFREMMKGTDMTLEAFLKIQATFVTFNYDRTLEHFFYQRLLHTFSLSSAEAMKALAEIKIHHIYGSLGEYDPGETSGKQQSSAELLQSANSIRLMYEDRVESNAVTAARRALSETQSWIFLGFGFDADNIKMLGIPDIGASSKTVGATRYGMAEGDWGRCLALVQPYFAMNHPGKRDWDSLKFLQETTLL